VNNDLGVLVGRVSEGLLKCTSSFEQTIELLRKEIRDQRRVLESEV
jgi:hypothetical protein